LKITPYSLPKEWWRNDYFCFSALRPLKTVFWILELKKCLEKLGLDGENHSRSQQRVTYIEIFSPKEMVFPP